MQIYSIGDIEFLYTVLHKVASITQSNDFVSILKIGLLLGFIAMITSGLSKNGTGMDIGSFAISCLLLAVMFVPKTTVTIKDAYHTTLTEKTVANVPVGIAMPASILSTIGYKLGLIFTTNNQSATSTTPGMNLTFTDSMGMLAKLRRFTNNNSATILNALGKDNNEINVQKNLRNYLADCTLIETKRFAQKSVEVLNGDVKNIFNAQLSTFRSMQEVYEDGAIKTKPLRCTEAGEKLKNILKFNTTNAKKAVNLAVGKKCSSNDTNCSAMGTINTTLNELFTSQINAQDWMLASVVIPALDEARIIDAYARRDSAGAIMVSQARAQRNAQWTAEQSLFATVSRPIMAFFESFVYAIAPIMAFVIALGTRGVSLAGKYFTTAIWVQLWIPIMSITDLYLRTTAKSQMAAYNENFVSLALVSNSDMYIQDWIATGGILASSVPAIALALLYGGAVTATHLTGRLQGGDYINEKIAAPDVVQPAAAVNMMPTYMADSFGALKTNAPIPKLNFSQSSSAEISNKTAQLDQVGNKLNQTFNAGHAMTEQGSHEFQFIKNAAENIAGSDNQNLSNALAKGIAYGQSRGMSHDLARQMATANIIDGTASFKPSIPIARLGGGVGFQYTDKEGRTQTFSESDAKQMQQIMQSGLGKDESTALAQVVSNANSHAKSYKYGSNAAKNHSESLGETIDTAQALSQEIAARKTQQEQIGNSLDVPANVAASSIRQTNPEFAKQLAFGVNAIGGDVRDRSNQLEARYRNYIPDPGIRRTAANLMALNQATNNDDAREWMGKVRDLLHGSSGIESKVDNMQSGVNHEIDKAASGLKQKIDEGINPNVARDTEQHLKNYLHGSNQNINLTPADKKAAQELYSNQTEVLKQQNVAQNEQLIRNAARKELDNIHAHSKNDALMTKSVRDGINDLASKIGLDDPIYIHKGGNIIDDDANTQKEALNIFKNLSNKEQNAIKATATDTFKPESHWWKKEEEFVPNDSHIAHVMAADPSYQSTIQKRVSDIKEAELTRFGNNLENAGYTKLQKEFAVAVMAGDMPGIEEKGAAAKNELIQNAGLFGLNEKQAESRGDSLLLQIAEDAKIGGVNNGIGTIGKAISKDSHP